MSSNIKGYVSACMMDNETEVGPQLVKKDPQYTIVLLVTLLQSSPWTTYSSSNSPEVHSGKEAEMLKGDWGEQILAEKSWLGASLHHCVIWWAMLLGSPYQSKCRAGKAPEIVYEISSGALAAQPILRRHQATVSHECRRLDNIYLPFPKHKGNRDRWLWFLHHLLNNGCCPTHSECLYDAEDGWNTCCSNKISICGSQTNRGSTFAFPGNATHGNGPSICEKNEVGEWYLPLLW